MVKTEKPLQIRLTEPVVFLRGPSTGLDFRGRPQPVQDAQPAMLRGLLTLRLSKPTRIRKILIKLEGKTRTEWPEGIGSLRIETSEENTIISETTTFFNAIRAQSSHSQTRRARSVGPGLPSAYWDQEDEVLVPWALDGRRPSDVQVEGQDGEDRGTGEPSEADRGRPRAPALPPRSASAAPSFFGTVSSDTTGQPSAADRFGVDRLSIRDRGPSPAYTPTPEPREIRRSSFRSSFSAASRLPDIPSSDRSISTSTERGSGEGSTLPVVSSALANEPVIASDEPSNVHNPSLPPSILESEVHRFGGSNEVRFAAESPSALTSDDDGARHAQQGQGGAPVRRTSAPSIRTMDSRFSASSSSLASQHVPTDDTHPVAAEVKTAQPSAVNSPAPSAPTSIHNLSSNEAHSGNATPTSLAPELPNSPESSEDRPTSSRVNSESIAPASSQPDNQIPRSVSNLSSHRPSATSIAELPEDGMPDHHKHKQHKFMGLHHALKSVKHKMSRSQSRPSSRARSAAGSRDPSGRSSPGASGHASREHTPYTPGSSSMSRRSSAGVAPAIPLHMLDQELRHVRHDRLDHAAAVEEARSSGRQRARTRDSSRSRSRTVSPGRRDGERSPSRVRGRNSGMKVLTGALGLGEDHPLEGDEDDEEGAHKWKEFRKGVYNYPISFPIPANAPPTLHTEFGSVMYRLKATVVRVGALTSNLVETIEVTMIATPQEDDLEETENVIVERQWEDQMRYQIALHGKAFPIGGIIPISVHLMPLTKCRVHRLTVILEEKIDYFAQDKKVTRHENPRKHILLFIKQTDRLERIVPLLPIISDSPTAAKESPLAQMAAQAAINNPSPDEFDPENDDHVYASLYEPLGPWILEKNLQIPDCHSTIKCTSKHEKTNIHIKHWLKVVIRVERGDDQALDNKGKRKQFDIIIETPIKILDCRVNAQMNSLPTYSAATPGAQDAIPGVCQIHGHFSRRFAPITPSWDAPGAPGASGAVVTSHMSGMLGTPPIDVGDLGRGRHRSRDRSGRRDVSIHPTRDGEDSLLERNIVYDRLMSGQELETGEQPPTYVEATAEGSRSSPHRKSPERGRSLGNGDEHGAIWVQSASRSRSRLRTQL